MRGVLAAALRRRCPQGRGARQHALCRGHGGEHGRPGGLQPRGGKALFVSAAAATRIPFIYLSAGVTDEIFRETLTLAAEAGTPFSGVLCGRATWQDGIPIYGKGGADRATHLAGRPGRPEYRDAERGACTRGAAVVGLLRRQGAYYCDRTGAARRAIAINCVRALRSISAQICRQRMMSIWR